MPWEQSDINGPVSEAVQDALTPVSNALGAVAPVLETANTLLDAAQTFVDGVKDPFAGLLDDAINELENLVNDTFGTGAFLLTVNPFKLEGVRQFDDFGIPLLTPADCIELMVESFDDLGDEKRPQFSDSATVSAFGIMATAPDLAGLLDLIRELVALFSIPEWELVLSAHEERNNTANVSSVVPDWESLRLNSFPPFDQMQRNVIGLLEAAKGTQVVPDSNISDLIGMIQKKVTRVQELTQSIQDILDQAAGSVTGLYTFELDIQTGGNNLIKSQLRDPFLEQCVPNGYTIASLFVGGGPSAVPVNNLKNLLI